MRVHIVLDQELVDELDRRAGPRQRSVYIAAIIRRALDDERHWDELEAGLGSISDEGHEWDAGPAGWVRSQRRSDSGRAG